MTINRSQAMEYIQESRESGDVVVGASETSYMAGLSQPQSSPPNVQNHHTAFMQCRFCCNCDSQCSYYGKGNFDSKGNYLGS